MAGKLIVCGINKKIGFKQILSEVNFSISPGELMVLKGSNGVGKTTLLNIIAGTAKMSSGKIFFNDRFNNISNKIGLLAHQPMVYETMTAKENMLFFGRMYAVKDNEKINSLLDRTGLYFFRNEPVHTYSRGMKQRLALALMLLHDPEILLYDEPFTGLDTSGQLLVKEIIKEMISIRKYQIVSTHNITMFSDFKYRVLSMEKGKLVEEKRLT